ncbi:hypothetical protein FRC12_011931 [Ceratobasidium sp. 428]|nr:hypothetical protein FRC12_011931 [Ceratobasidium sp. 428]
MELGPGLSNDYDRDRRDYQSRINGSPSYHPRSHGFPNDGQPGLAHVHVTAQIDISFNATGAN